MSEETITLTKADLAKLLEEMATASKKPASKGKRGAKKQTEEQKAANRTKIDKEAVAAFEKAGFGKVVPRVDVMTFKKWLENGRIVKKGEKSVKVGSFPLFHLSQTDPLKSEDTVH